MPIAALICEKSKLGGGSACFSRVSRLAWGLLVWGLSLGGRGGCEAGAGFGAAGAGW